jgi:hypothetical protein
MSYIINKTDGTVLTEVVDGAIDQTSSDVTLVGKNASSYGEFVNENFVHILENFANTTAPNNPIEGQLWYDTSEGRLKVYDGSGFKVSGGTIVSNTVPSTIAQGDIWIDSLRQQMYFNDGVATMLAGPIYTQSQGISGFQVIDILDTNVIGRTIVLVYVAQILIGIFSKAAFTPATAIPGYTGDIKIGFNVSNYSGVKFNVPVSQADYLLAPDGVTKKYSTSFVSTTDDSSTLGTLSIVNSTPLIIGQNSNFEFLVGSGTVQMQSNITNQNFQINSLNNAGLSTSIFVNAATSCIGIYTALPTATLDVNGDARIRGDLTVEGTLTSINTTNVEIKDKLIELAKVDTPTDTTADGGGIALKGATDKTLTWSNASDAWTSSEDFNIVTGKSYRVSGLEVLNQTTLGATVTDSSLTSVGILNTVQVNNILISGSTISYVNPAIANNDVTIAPKGTGTVNVSGKKISNLADPDNNTDAVNFQTLVANIQTAPLGLTINVGSLTDSQIATNILDKIYPTYEHLDGTACRIWCLDLNAGAGAAKQFAITASAWTFVANI